jgi:hypothetical protein
MKPDLEINNSPFDEYDISLTHSDIVWTFAFACGLVALNFAVIASGVFAVVKALQWAGVL